MRILRSTALMVLAALVVPEPAQAGAWIRKPGHFFVKLGANFSESYDPENARADLAKQQAITTSLFAEIGLPYRMDLVIDVPYIVATNEYQSGGRYRNHSIGDTRLQFDRGLFEALQLTAALEVKVPTYRPLSERHGELVDLEGAPPRSKFPELGNGAVELTPKLLYGKSFYPRPAWLTAELGFRGRFEGLTHGVYGAVGAGAWVWPGHLALALYGSAAYNFGSPSFLPLRPTGEEPDYAVYFAGSFILSAAPWAPWLKLFGSAGAVVVAGRRVQEQLPGKPKTTSWLTGKTGTDFGLGIAIDY